MKTTIYIKPRSSGKTSQAVNFAKAVQGEVLVLVYNSVARQEWLNQLGDSYSNIHVNYYYPDRAKIDRMFQGRTFEAVIIDEFLLGRTIPIYQNVSRWQQSIKHLYLVGTPDLAVRKVLFDDIARVKSMYRYEAAKEYILTKYKDSTDCNERIFDYWWYSFLTDFGAYIVKDDFRYDVRTDEHVLGQYGTDAYNLIIKNQIWLD